MLGIGGSATVDGGVGMAMALGGKFLNANGDSVALGGGNVGKIHSICLSGLDSRLKDVEIEVACDVENPLTGENGAAYVYGPQKGATPEMVEILEKNLSKLAEIVRRDFGKEIEFVKGSGAAGGLGAGLLGFCDGVLKPGIDLVLENTNFDEKVKDANLVITGEGKLDSQTFYGKTPVGVSMRASKYQCPAIAIAGCTVGDLSKLHEKNILAYFSIVNGVFSRKCSFRK